MASKHGILMALGMLQEIFPLWNQTEITEEIWARVLKNVSDEELDSAIDQFLHEHTSACNVKQAVPGDILKIINQNNGLTWDKAFNEIMQNAHPSMYPPIKSNGEPKPINWSNPKIYELMNHFGGAEYFHSLKNSEIGTARAQFRQAFEGETISTSSRLPLLPHQTNTDLPALKPAEPVPMLPEAKSLKAQVLAKQLEKAVGHKSQAEVISLVAAKLTRQSKKMS